MTALKPGSVIVEHEVNQYLQDKVDLSQATTRLINQVTEIGSDPATRKHFQISSVEVFPVKSGYFFCFLNDTKLSPKKPLSIDIEINSPEKGTGCS